MTSHPINFNLIIKYILTGSLVAAFQLFSFLFFFEFLDLDYLFSSTVAFVLTVIFSFIIQRALVFRVDGNRAVETKVAFGAVFANSIFGLALNCLIMYVGVEYVHESATFWQVISMVIISIYNFFFYRYMFRPQ